jgi:hypothetical protein
MEWEFWEEGLSKEFTRRLKLAGKLGFLPRVQIAL